MLHPFAPRDMPFGRPMTAPGLGRIPVTVVTGFLGAGKTTLIRELLKSEAGAGSALIVNEFGEIGIDDALLRTSDERTVLLGNGCVCCAASSDLHRALRELFADRMQGRVPDFGRVVIETSGIADPTPVLQALATDRTLGTRFALSALVTVVDAATASASARLPEWRKQVALADRIVVAKSDLAAPGDLDALHALLDGLAPHAERVVAVGGAVDPAWILAAAPLPAAGAAPQPHQHHHHSYTTFTITREAPIAWPIMQRSLDTLASVSGAGLLRLKGFVKVKGRRGPVVVHRVQHLAHAPEELSEWPEGIEERTSLVLIGQELEESRSRALLEAVWAFDDSA